jgi:MazG family protein
MNEEQQISTSNSDPPDHLSRGSTTDEALGRVLALVRFLRDQCPWDARQTPRSLLPYLLEEAHEVADAVRRDNDFELPGELGDLLLNVAFQIVLAEERGAFGAETVVTALETKMRDRHPHVYGDAEEAPDWEGMKASQRSAAATDGNADPFAGVSEGIEPLSRAVRVQERAAGVGFDWPDVAGAFKKLREEMDELEPLLAVDKRSGETLERLAEEAGDVLFSVVNVCRLAGLHPMTALEDATAKFTDRFRRLAARAQVEGISMEEASLETLDHLWEAVKAETER